MPALRTLPTLGRWPRRLLALGCLLLAVLSAVGATPSSDSDGSPRRVPVVVASRDLPAGRVLAESDLALAHWPPKLIPAGTATAVSSLVGRRAAAALTRGEPVVRTRLLGPGLAAGLSPGEVAVPVRVMDPVNAALLRPGDHVTLFAARPRTALGARSPHARVLADRVLILAVLPAKGHAPEPDRSAGSTLVVAVDRDFAGRFATLDQLNVLAVVGKPP